METTAINPQSAVTLPAASDIDKFIRAQRSAGTSELYEREIRLFFEFAARHPGLDKEQMALSYVESISGTLESSTIARKIVILNCFFEFLKERGRIAVNPFKIVKPPRVPNIGKTYCPTREEVERLLSVPDKTTYRGLRDYLMLYLMAYLGLRVSEARKLRTGDIKSQGDGDKTIRFIQLKIKGAKERKIPITEFLHDSLRRIIGMKKDVMDGSDFHLFTRRITSDEAVTSRYVELMVKRCSGNAQISPHSLRVYFINEVRRHTNDVEIARRLAGHESILTTQRYFRESDELGVLPEEVVKGKQTAVA